MTGEFRARQRAFREREIVRTATRVLADVGCRAFTMNEVAARLGVSKATLYQHFRGREDLIRRCVDEARRDAIQRARAGAERVPPDRRLRHAAAYLVGRCLGVAGGEDDPAPCCLSEVECPFLDWGEVDRLFGTFGARGAGDGLGFGQALRALSASVLQRRRMQGERPTAQDVGRIVRFLFPSG